MMLTELADVLRAGGLEVVETAGWQRRGHGRMTSVDGVTVHHTASGGLGKTLGLSTVQNGRPGLEGPLAHLYLNREGVFYVVAAGLAWHAGVSLKPGQTNAHRIGIEALAAGDGWNRDWPKTQMVALVTGCRVLSEHYRFPVAEILGHKETCSPVGRKIDPSFDMGSFRAAVKNEIATAEQRGNEVQLNDKVELSPIAAREMSVPGYTQRETGEELSVSYLLQWGGAGMYRLLGKVDQLATEVAELRSVNTQQAALLTDLVTLLKDKPE